MNNKKYNNLKIAFVLWDFPVISQTFIVNQIVDLIDKGHEVTIFALEENITPILHRKVVEYNLLERTYFRANCSKDRYSKLMGCLIRNSSFIDFKRFLKKFKFFPYQKKLFDLDFFSNNLWILKNQKFDIVHAHFGPAGAYIAELFSFGFFAKSKFVTTFHGYDLNPALLLEFKKKYIKLFKEVDLMIVNTMYLKGLLKKITDKSDIKVLPVGLDTSVFKKSYYKNEEYFNIIYVGRLIKLKGADRTIEIMNLLISKGYENFRLFIVGDGEMKDDLYDLIQKYCLEDTIKLFGALSQDNIVEIMDRSDIFLLPGIYDKDGRGETQGLVIQEAQAMQLPVIVSNVGGMKYGLMDGETGFVVEEGDIKTFAEKILMLYNDPDLRKRMGEKGRKFVQSSYESTKIGIKLENLYREIMKNT